MRDLTGMKNELRGRPRLPLTMCQVLEAVYRHGQIVAAGRELRCSGAYIHARLGEQGLTLAMVLDAESVDDLLKPKVRGERNDPGL